MTSCRVLAPVLLMLLVMMLPDGAESHTTCTAVTTIYNTSVTCLFGENIAHDSFNVQFFFPNTSVEPKVPLVCNRLQSGKLTCQKQRGVNFDEKQEIRDGFTFTRPSSLDKLEGGHYQCQTVPSTGEEANHYCPLTYIDVPRYVPLAMLSTPQPPTEEDGGDPVQIFLMVTVVIFLIFVVIMIVTAIMLYINPKSLTKWTNHALWPGVNPGETSPHSASATQIPGGLSAYFYNLGYTDALKDEKKTATTEQPRKVIAVIGATEGQEASVARAFAHHPEYMVRYLTLDVNTQHAQQLGQDGADLILYDQCDRKSIEFALEGAYAVFVNTVTDFCDPNCIENENSQGRFIADACQAMGVGHVVLSSQIHITRVSGLPVRNMETEDYMRSLRLPLTCLTMPIYYEDLCGLVRSMNRDGFKFELMTPKGLKSLDMMSVEDVGPVVVDVVSNRDRYLNKTLRQSGDKLTIPKVAAVLNKYLTPKTFKKKQLSKSEFQKLDLSEARDWATMFNLSMREDQRSKVRDTRLRTPQPRSFEVWVQQNREDLNRVLS